MQIKIGNYNNFLDIFIKNLLFVLYANPCSPPSLSPVHPPPPFPSAIHSSEYNFYNSLK